MRHSLGIGGDSIMHLAGEVDMFGSERGEDFFDESDAFIDSTVLNNNLVKQTVNATGLD